ncbi:carbohydrate kinase family protein [Candidatus Uhrbacteria bacterium]|nr:MAG: carbohydrate kinase family protein [Candidatus Uhrbacteria bacterium]
MLDLIAIGDSTLDVFLEIDDATLSCQLNKKQCLLCFDYADKIPVKEVIQVPGAGNASNAAVGGRRLGMKTAIVSIVGNDDIGREIVSGWKREGVATTYVTTDDKHETNYSTVLNFKGERTILVHHERRTYRLPKLAAAKWIYYTSLGQKHERQERQLLAHLKTHPHIKLAFNPGTHQLHRGLKALKPVIARSDLFIVNRDEAARLLEGGERPIHNMLLHFHQMGAKISVITDGPEGSYATDGKTVWFLPIFKGPIKERTGAGDSYTIGLIYGLFSGRELSEAMRYGTANAWSVVQDIGPQRGLLKKSEMQTALKRFTKIKAKKEINGNRK